MYTIEKFIKKQWYLILFACEFIFFAYILYSVPPTGDRWMEETTCTNMESFWRWFFCQIRWYSIANGRVLSNLVCYFLERNLMIRALSNAGFITGCSIIMCKITGKMRPVPALLSFMGMLFVSDGIRQEVYYYATTLFVGTAFLALLSVWQIKELVEREFEPKKLRRVILILFVSSIWLENLSIALTATLAVWLLYTIINRKSYVKEISVMSGISLLGTFFLFASSVLGSNGRLRAVNSSFFSLDKLIKNYKELVEQVFIENAFLWALLLILIVLYTKQKKKAWKQIYCILFGGSIGLLLLFFGLFSLEEIYDIISTNPTNVEYVRNVVGWQPFTFPLFSSMIGLGKTVFARIIPLLLMLTAVHFGNIIKKSSMEFVGFFYLSVGVGGALISIIGLQNGCRITSLTIFMMIAMIVEFADRVFEHRTRVWKKVGICLLLICLFIKADSYMLTAQKLSAIGRERERIAAEVACKQKSGEWNYNEIVTMPRLNADMSRPDMFGGNVVNPQKEVDPHYPYMLSYYGLDEDTKVAFNDSANKLYVSIEEDKVKLTLQTEEGKDYTGYIFQINNAVAFWNFVDGSLVYSSDITTEQEIEIACTELPDCTLVYSCILISKDGDETIVYSAEATNLVNKD